MPFPISGQQTSSSFEDLDCFQFYSMIAMISVLLLSLDPDIVKFSKNYVDFRFLMSPFSQLVINLEVFQLPN